jgi:hypothetical protein
MERDAVFFGAPNVSKEPAVYIFRIGDIHPEDGGRRFFQKLFTYDQTTRHHISNNVVTEFLNITYIIFRLKTVKTHLTEDNSMLKFTGTLC